MAVLVALSLILAMTGLSDATWCVCRSDVSDSALQKALDYACGAGADCTPILQNGACFQPNTLKAHCSYAVNSYFQKKAQAQGACVFSNAATLVTSDPSTGGTCSYPSSLGSSGTTTPSTTTPSTSTTPSTTTPSILTPNTPTTTNGGITGGINTGLGPSGIGINTDTSNGDHVLQNSNLVTVILTFWFSGLVFWQVVDEMMG